MVYPGFFYGKANILGEPVGILRSAEICQLFRFVGRQIVLQLGIFTELTGTLLSMLQETITPPVQQCFNNFYEESNRPLRPPEYASGKKEELLKCAPLFLKHPESHLLILTD